MTARSSCSGPRWSAASEFAVAPSSTPRLNELERLVGPSARCCVTPQTASDVAPRTSPRAGPDWRTRSPCRTWLGRLGWRQTARRETAHGTRASPSVSPGCLRADSTPSGSGSASDPGPDDLSFQVEGSTLASVRKYSLVAVSRGRLRFQGLPAAGGLKPRRDLRGRRTRLRSGVPER